MTHPRGGLQGSCTYVTNQVTAPPTSCVTDTTAGRIIVNGVSGALPGMSSLAASSANSLNYDINNNHQSQAMIMSVSNNSIRGYPNLLSAGLPSSPSMISGATGWYIFISSFHPPSFYTIIITVINLLYFLPILSLVIPQSPALTPSPGCYSNNCTGPTVFTFSPANILSAVKQNSAFNQVSRPQGAEHITSMPANVTSQGKELVL